MTEEKNLVIKGYHITYPIGGGFYNDKFTWICAECGKEWFSKNQAENCRNRNHTSFYTIDHNSKYSDHNPKLVKKFKCEGMYNVKNIELENLTVKTLKFVYNKELRNMNKSASKKKIIEYLNKIKKNEMERMTYGYKKSSDKNKFNEIMKNVKRRIKIEYNSLRDKYNDFIDGNKNTIKFEKFTKSLKWKDKQGLIDKLKNQLKKYSDSTRVLIKSMEQKESESKIEENAKSLYRNKMNTIKLYKKVIKRWKEI